MGPGQRTMSPEAAEQVAHENRQQALLRRMSALESRVAELEAEAKRRRGGRPRKAQEDAA